MCRFSSRLRAFSPILVFIVLRILIYMRVGRKKRTQIISLENQKDDSRNLTQQLNQLLQHTLAQCSGYILLLIRCPRTSHALLRENLVIPSRDRAGEQRELLVRDTGHLVCVLAHARLVCLDHRQPQLGVVAAQLARDLPVQAVIVEDDVEVVTPAVRVGADGDVAAVRIAVERGIVAEDHLVEDVCERCRDFVAVDSVAVEEVEVVGAPAGDEFHDENALLGPHDCLSLVSTSKQEKEKR